MNKALATDSKWFSGQRLCLCFCIVIGCLFISACEYTFSDVATRIRYALIEEKALLDLLEKTGTVLELQPDHWPDGCRNKKGYRLTLAPYRGGKQVATGDIVVECKGGGSYYTGMGSEAIYVEQEMTIEKGSDETLYLVLQKTEKGLEITGLK